MMMVGTANQNRNSAQLSLTKPLEVIVQKAQYPHFCSIAPGLPSHLLHQDCGNRVEPFSKLVLDKVGIRIKQRIYALEALRLLNHGDFIISSIL